VRKVKRCCGVRRGASEAELAKAFLAVEARAAAWVLRDHHDEQLEELHDALIDLPSLDPSLRWPLPRLLTPELVRLGAALADEDEDAEAVRGLLGGVLVRLDTPPARAGLARAVPTLRGGGRLGEELAAAAVIDLASPSTTLVRASLLQAVAVDAGAVPTASGLVVARR
jgi:hypothetical protein